MQWTNEKLSHNPHQRSSDWYGDRIGKLTASCMADAISFLKDGKSSATREKLIKRILAERMTDQVTNQFVSEAMQWGIDNEERARSAYEEATGHAVNMVGFIPHESIEHYGASPDGLILQDGLVEFKCPSTEVHIQYMINDQVPEQYKPQMLTQLACTKRKWCDFVSYDPRVLIPKKRIFVRHFEPSKSEILKIEEQAQQFLNEVEKIFERILND